jgi:hypothetical protein
MIDHASKVIFIHQRKAAGISIMTAWGTDLSQPDTGRYNDGVLSAEWHNRSADETSYFVFSAVRNPFDRLISAWKYLWSTQKRCLLDVLSAPPMEGHDYRHLTRPQIAILRHPVSGKLVVDDLIRYERLQDDFDRICDRVGKPRRALPRLNETTRERDYRSYFDARTRAMAEQRFADDLVQFGYEF